jgi:hypothetical protein
VNNFNISLVPLQQANLCLDCEGITAGHTNCLCCGSRALLNIARILNDRTAHVQLAKSPIPSRLTPARQWDGSCMESGTGYFNRERREPLRFPLRISENRA